MSVASSLETLGVLGMALECVDVPQLTTQVLFAISQFPITLDGVLSMPPSTQVTTGLLSGQQSRSRIQSGTIKRCRKNFIRCQNCRSSYLPTLLHGASTCVVTASILVSENASLDQVACRCAVISNVCAFLHLWTIVTVGILDLHTIRQWSTEAFSIWPLPVGTHPNALLGQMLPAHHLKHPLKPGARTRHPRYNGLPGNLTLLTPLLHTR